jgi:hypothetical protein
MGIVKPPERRRMGAAMNNSTRSMVATVGTTVAVWFVVDQVRRHVAPRVPTWASALVVGTTTVVAQRAISKQMTRLVEVFE